MLQKLRTTTLCLSSGCDWQLEIFSFSLRLSLGQTNSAGGVADPDAKLHQAIPTHAQRCDELIAIATHSN